ncbi:hypothetical protein D3C81_2003080 [compost metagenome]
MADQLAASGDFLGYPGALDGISVFDGNRWLLKGELADLLARALRLIEAFGGLLDESVIKHGDNLCVQGLTMTARVRSTSRPPRVMKQASA